MVHFEGIPQAKVAAPQAEEPPRPRMTMAERLALRQKEFSALTTQESSTPEEDRLQAMIRGVNDRVAAQGAAAREMAQTNAAVPEESAFANRPVVQEAAPAAKVVELKPKVAEISGDAAVFARMEGKTVEQMDGEERALHAKMMQANAERARERLRKAQTTSQALIAARDKLLQIPNAVSSTRSVERRPMPRIDSQRVYDTEYGPLMILSVDEARGVYYFATPEERRRVDAALIKDEGQSSLGAAKFEHTLQLTAEQARALIERAPAPSFDATTQETQRPNTSHLQSRYGLAA